jgi:hypothetical protein
MSQGFSDTVLMWQSTREAESRFDEVFDPDVKVLLSWRDVEAAVEAGAVVPSEAYALWANWASPGSPARLAAQSVLGPQPDLVAKFGLHDEAASNPGGIAATVSGPLLDASREPLEMKLPGQLKGRQGVPSEMRVLLLVVALALVVWAAGKGFGVW